MKRKEKLNVIISTNTGCPMVNNVAYKPNLLCLQYQDSIVSTGSTP